MLALKAGAGPGVAAVRNRAVNVVIAAAGPTLGAWIQRVAVEVAVADLTIGSRIAGLTFTQGALRHRVQRTARRSIDLRTRTEARFAVDSLQRIAIIPLTTRFTVKPGGVVRTVQAEAGDARKREREREISALLLLSQSS